MGKKKEGESEQKRVYRPYWPRFLAVRVFPSFSFQTLWGLKQGPPQRGKSLGERDERSGGKRKGEEVRNKWYANDMPDVYVMCAIEPNRSPAVYGDARRINCERALVCFRAAALSSRR